MELEKHLALQNKDALPHYDKARIIFVTTSDEEICVSLQYVVHDHVASDTNLVQ